MALTKKECNELFDGYILDNEFPLKINLPRELVFALVDQGIVTEALIDLTWYYDRGYRDNPFSLYNQDLKKQMYIEEYTQWRNSVNLKLDNRETNQKRFTSFYEILADAEKTNQTVVIGEYHNDSTPNAILMHNIPFLKQANAVIFMESIPVELQEEVNKSIVQKYATPLLDAFLRLNYKGEKLTAYYTHKNLIKTCIQEGIPIIGCEALASQAFSLEGLRYLESGGQACSILRMLQNYEHYKAIGYAKRTFPTHTFHVCLIGSAHAYTYRSVTNGEIHPGIVDITEGIYVQTVDSDEQFNRNEGWVIISQEVFFDELKIFLNLTQKIYDAIDGAIFKAAGANITFVRNINNILRSSIVPQNLKKLNEVETKQAMKSLYSRYSNYLQPRPPERSMNLIEGFDCYVNSGSQIIMQNNQEFFEREGTLCENESILEYNLSLYLCRFLDEIGIFAIIIPIIGQLYAGARLANDFAPLTKGAYCFFSCNKTSDTDNLPMKKLEWNFAP